MPWDEITPLFTWLLPASPSFPSLFTLLIHKQLFQTSLSPPSPSHSQSMSLPRLPWGNNQESINNAFVSPHYHSYQLLLCMLPFFPLWWMKYLYSYQRMSLHCTPGPTPLAFQDAMTLDIVDYSQVLEIFSYLITWHHMNLFSFHVKTLLCFCWWFLGFLLTLSPKAPKVTLISSVALHLTFLSNLNSTWSLPWSANLYIHCHLYISICIVSNKMSNFSWFKQNSWPYSLIASSPVFSISDRGIIIHQIVQSKT